MAYEPSSKNGRNSFVPDRTRGHWAVPSDFLYACWGSAFKMDIFHLSWFFFFDMGIYTLIPYFVCMALFVVPINAIQSFLGQFSSSGFISVFRIAPLFKGMGYISLAVNFMMLSHMSAFAAIPLFYLFHSVRPTLPWSCESFLEWSNEVPTNGEISICNKQYYGTYAATNNTTTLSLDDPNDHTFVHIPSAVFFRTLFKNYDLTHKINFSLSWELLLCMLVVWTVIAIIFCTLFTTEKMGKLIRCTIWLLMLLLVICLLRMLFLPHAKEALEDYFIPYRFRFYTALTGIPVFCLASFGTGWGNIVSLASYNKFKTNIMRLSWLVSLGQLVIFILFGLMNHLISTHYAIITGNTFYGQFEDQWLLYVGTGSVLADLELPNLWCILFFSLLLLSSLISLLIQIFAVFTAIFDEFQFLRSHRQKVTLTLIALLFVCSLLFSTNHGLSFFSVLPVDALFTQSVLNLLLLLVVLWIYGRVRLQRDIEFMLSQSFATWRVYVLRFLAPLVLLVALAMCFMFGEQLHYESVTMAIAAVVFILIPWLFVPGYAIRSIFQTTGSLGARVKRCCRPTDWYPVGPAERQRYEDAMGNMNVTHQLNAINAGNAVYIS